jgi:hypothetical protein
MKVFMSEVINHEKLAIRWFFGAGAAAIIFALFLVWADDYLANSTSEKRLSNILREIRTAQSSLPSNVSDQRQLQDARFPEINHDSSSHEDHH